MEKRLQPFRSVSFVLFLLVAFLLLCMPTVSIGDNFMTSSSSSLSHDVPNSVKATKRTSPSPSCKLLFLAALLLYLFHFRFLAYPSYRLPTRKCAFLPLHSIRIRKLLLMPLKFTTSYVRA